MKVTHLPVGLTSLNDVVNLEWPINVLMKYSRQDKSYREARKILISGCCQGCEHCGGVGMEVHHRKPIWACAVDHIMSFQPSSTYDAHQNASSRLPKGSEEAFAEWHSLSNLIVLCPECHLKQQATDDRHWKKELAVKHRLVYTITWGDRYRGFAFGKSPKCPQTLPEYIEWYLAKQAVEL